MPPADILIAFALATLVFGYMPGPGMLYATARTLAEGRRAGLMAALGLHLGGYAHVLAAALGLALVFKVMPVLYITLKLAGAAYLIWLGLQMWRPQDAKPSHLPTPQTASTAFGQSVLVEVLNPKTALFYVAFLPQFTQAETSLPVWTQLLIFGTAVNVVFSSADILCVLLAEKLRAALSRSTNATQRLRRVGGTLLIALGTYTALTKTGG